MLQMDNIFPKMFTNSSIKFGYIYNLLVYEDRCIRTCRSFLAKGFSPYWPFLICVGTPLTFTRGCLRKYKVSLLHILKKTQQYRCTDKIMSV